MARRAPSAATDDSQKENSGLRTQDKAEKVKQEKVAKHGLAARVGEERDDEERRVSHAQEADSDEEREDGDEVDDEEDAGSPKGRKRARANTVGESHPSGSNKGKSKSAAEPRTLPRDEDGYIPGSIVRIRLENFVTYDFVEFNPGPFLNMILGPNGTGKSSIACAICLGLNFPPSTLGRAAEVSSFVKLGQKEGYIEIELKGTKGKSNLTIRRTLSSNSKSSQYFINGKTATGREVNSRMQELNVQVTNLCSFLPQDKVAEFARMTPQQLLRETQRAAGNSHLTAWHDLLIQYGKDLKRWQEELSTDREQLHTAEERNANLEREVKAYQERRRLELEIEFFELMLPFQQYQAAKREYLRLKDLKNELGAKVKRLKKKNTPITDLKAQLERQHQKLDEQRELKKNATRAKFACMKKLWTQNENLENEAEQLKIELDSLKKEERDRQKKIDKLAKELKEWQHELDNPPVKENTAELEEMRRVKTEEIRHVRDLHEELQERQRRCVQEEVVIKQRIDSANAALSKLNNADAQKLDNLMRWDRDCADTVVWLRNNQQRFKMRVFEPPFLSLSVPDKRYANAIEACFGANDQKCFIAQCEEDYQLLNRLVADTPEALGRTARINTWYRRKTAIHEPPCSLEELHSLGFDCYAIDCVQFPDGMEWFLQNSLNLHRTPLAVANPNRVDPARAMDRLSRDGGIRYIIGNIMNSVSRSRYGKRLAQNSTREIHQAKNFSAATVDQDAKRNIEQQLRAAQGELALQKEAMKGLTDEERQLKEDHRRIKEEGDAIQARLKKIVEIQRKQQLLKTRIESSTRRLEEYRNAPSAEEGRAKLKEDILRVAMKRAKIVKGYQELLREAIKEQTEATKSGLLYLQVGAKKIALEKIYQARVQEANKAQADFQEADAQYKAAKTDSKTKLLISKDKLDGAEQEVRQRFQQLEEAGKLEDEEWSVNSILGEMETKRAELELNSHTNAGVVETYKKRQAEIATLTQKIETQDEKIQKLEHNIKRTRDLWEPALSQLVDSIGEKFSGAFDRIGCAGQINIAQNEDFDKWAIEILVKFRDEERLQPLTAERQSGGERSLTTILYLMSLTEHARAPFSLVDEINQGMDSRAERAVHDSLVSVTCQPDSGQYFLITPKLLADLTYHERMKVLCVANGEWLPEDHMTGSLMQMIDAYVQAQG